ncbi:MAG: response regulator transcription factor [Kineosporiaceae bacterium]
MDGGPHVTGTARQSVAAPGAGEPLPGWTADQALDLVARQGYSCEQAARLTGFAAGWLRAHGRPGRSGPAGATPRPTTGADPPARSRPRIDVVTDRELDVLRLAGDGLTTVEIAANLGCSERTVKMTLQAVVERFGLRNRTHAVAFAIRKGLI